MEEEASWLKKNKKSWVSYMSSKGWKCKQAFRVIWSQKAREGVLASPDGVPR